MLTDRLDRLVADGLLRREPYQDPGQRRRHEYRLTDKGIDLYPVLLALQQWGNTYLADPDGSPIEFVHRDCAEPVDLVLRCRAGHELSSNRQRRRPRWPRRASPYRLKRPRRLRGMTDPLDPLDRPVGRLLRLAQFADPQQVVETLSMTVAEIGGIGRRAVPRRLRPVAAQAAPGRAGRTVSATEVASLDGSMAGRVFVSGRAVGRRARRRLACLGARRGTRAEARRVGHDAAAWDEAAEEFCVELGIAAAHLVSTANGYTDRLAPAAPTQGHVARRGDAVGHPASADVQHRGHHRGWLARAGVRRRWRLLRLQPQRRRARFRRLRCDGPWAAVGRARLAWPSRPIATRAASIPR